jgi:hypothetical protein
MQLIYYCSRESPSNFGYKLQAFRIKLNLTNLTYVSIIKSHFKCSIRPDNHIFSHLQ